MDQWRSAISFLIEAPGALVQAVTELSGIGSALSAANAAAAFYCGTYLLICLSYNLLWFTAATRRRLVHAHVEPVHVRRIRQAYLVALPIYLIATIVAWFSAYAGLAISSLLWLLWARLSYGPEEATGNIETHSTPASVKEA